MNALELNGVTKSYPDFCLNNISFALPAGCILGLIGENGAGKSTTIKLILDMARRDRGEIKILGWDNQKDSRLLKEEIGVVLDEASFPLGITAKDVNHIMKHTYQHWEETTFYQYIHRFSLPPQKPFKDYSRGMKMKLAIAVALSHHAKLLILDEATSGLDPIVRDEILDLFYEFTRDENHSILISSHIVSDLEKLCDYIAFIHQGKLLFCEEKDRLLDKYGILRCSKNDFSAVEPAAVKGCRLSDYQAEALVERSKTPSCFTLSRPSIEDIIVFTAKGGKNA